MPRSRSSRSSIPSKVSMTSSQFVSMSPSSSWTCSSGPPSSAFSLQQHEKHSRQFSKALEVNIKHHTTRSVGFIAKGFATRTSACGLPRQPWWIKVGEGFFWRWWKSTTGRRYREKSARSGRNKRVSRASSVCEVFSFGSVAEEEGFSERRC